MRWPLGVVTIVYGNRPADECARLAREDGFEHIDVIWESPGGLVLPVGNRIASGRPRPGCTAGAMPDGPGAWEKTVALFRKAPNALLEPWPGSCVASIKAVREIVAEVPGLRIALDTGHVACWGEDPAELADLAGHVQLRQARQGEPQLLEGDVDFAAFFRRLELVGYRGLLSVEYFDLPDRGWPLDDPRAHACQLAAQLRSLG